MPFKVARINIEKICQRKPFVITYACSFALGLADCWLLYIQKLSELLLRISFRQAEFSQPVLCLRVIYGHQWAPSFNRLYIQHSTPLR